MTDEFIQILTHLRRLNEKMDRLQEDMGSLRFRVSSLVLPAVQNWLCATFVDEP